MSEGQHLFLDQLGRGKELQIHASVPYEPEAELRFAKPVKVSGKAYLAEEELIIHVSIEAEAEMPCKICSEWTEVTLDLPDLYEAVPTKEIRDGVFDLTPFVHEQMMLALPEVVECEKGSCPAREKMKQYFKRS